MTWMTTYQPLNVVGEQQKVPKSRYILQDVIKVSCVGRTEWRKGSKSHNVLKHNIIVTRIPWVEQAYPEGWCHTSWRKNKQKTPKSRRVMKHTIKTTRGDGPNEHYLNWCATIRGRRINKGLQILSCCERGNWNRACYMGRRNII